MKPFRFHREALAEAKAAAEHYAAISPLLGRRFYDAVDQLVGEVCAQHTLYRLFDPPTRRHFRRAFPCAVIYLDRPDHVWSVAVAPFKMRPATGKTGSPERASVHRATPKGAAVERSEHEAVRGSTQPER